MGSKVETKVADVQSPFDRTRALQRLRESIDAAERALDAIPDMGDPHEPELIAAINSIASLAGKAISKQIRRSPPKRS